MANFYLIRELCERNKMTIRELASQIGKDESSIQKLIRKGSTSTATLEDISKVLEVHPGIFFESVDNSTYINGNKNPIGNKNQIGNNNVIYGSQVNEIEHLKQLVAEKERTIQILMSNQKQ